MTKKIVTKDKIKFFKGSSNRIVELQKNDGSIPWFKEGVFDAWNHLESVMALNLLGYKKAHKYGENLKKKILLKLKKHGKNSSNLIETINFIKERNF